VGDFPADVIPAGSGAGGHVKNLYFNQKRRLKEYLEDAGEADVALENASLRSPEYRYLETLRGKLQQEGVHLGRLGRLYGVDPFTLHGETLEGLRDAGLILVEGDVTKLTLLGMVWYSNLAVRFTAKRGSVSHGR
jgi:coproporphyrinogen III oxidase-like Fe-S oxidoreductase